MEVASERREPAAELSEVVSFIYFKQLHLLTKVYLRLHSLIIYLKTIEMWSLGYKHIYLYLEFKFLCICIH